MRYMEKNENKDNQIDIPKDFLNFSTSKYTVELGRNSEKCSLLRLLIATVSLGISKVSSWVRVLTNLAGFPAQSSPVGILLPGGTTDPASRIEWVSIKEFAWESHRPPSSSLVRVDWMREAFPARVWWTWEREDERELWVFFSFVLILFRLTVVSV